MGLSPEKIILAVRIRTTGTSYQRDGMKMIKQSLREKYGFSDVYLELYEQKHLEGSADPVRPDPNKSIP
jgi:hypothetical protein